MNSSGVETATVLEANGSRAKVVTNKSTSCNECGKAEAGICGKGGTGMILEVRNSCGARKGDTVTIEISKDTHIKAYFWAFALPVIALFIGTYAGHHISEYTGIKGLEVVAGLSVLAVSIAYSLRKIHKLDKSSEFYIKKILHDPAQDIDASCSEGADYLTAFKKNMQT